MDWFRSWHGAPTDSKWLVIARRAGVTPGEVSAVFWALLDYASQHAERGSIAGFDVEIYAAWAGWEESAVAAILDAMRAKGVITGGDTLAAWDKRQPRREDNSTERVRNHRQRYASVTRNSDVTNGNVTQCNADETQCNAPDKIREDKIREDRNSDELLPPEQPEQPAEKKTTKKRTATEPTAQQAMFQALADVTMLDAKLKAKQLGKTASELLKAEYTPEHVQRFREWWATSDWRGQRGGTPTLAQVVELIKQANTPRAHANANGKNGSSLTAEDWDGYAKSLPLDNFGKYDDEPVTF